MLALNRLSKIIKVVKKRYSWNHSFFVNMCGEKLNLDFVDYPEMVNQEHVFSAVNQNKSLSNILSMDTSDYEKADRFLYEDVLLRQKVENWSTMELCKVSEAFIYDVPWALGFAIPKLITAEIIEKYGTDEMKSNLLDKIQQGQLNGMPVELNKNESGSETIAQFYTMNNKDLSLFAVPYIDVNENPTTETWEGVETFFTSPINKSEFNISDIPGLDYLQLALLNLGNYSHVKYPFENTKKKDILLHAQLLDNLLVSSLCVGIQKELLSLLFLQTRSNKVVEKPMINHDIYKNLIVNLTILILKSESLLYLIAGNWNLADDFMVTESLLTYITCVENLEETARIMSEIKGPRAMQGNTNYMDLLDFVDLLKQRKPHLQSQLMSAYKKGLSLALENDKRKSSYLYKLLASDLMMNIGWKYHRSSGKYKDIQYSFNSTQIRDVFRINGYYSLMLHYLAQATRKYSKEALLEDPCIVGQFGKLAKRHFEFYAILSRSSRILVIKGINFYQYFDLMNHYLSYDIIDYQTSTIVFCNQLQKDKYMSANHKDSQLSLDQFTNPAFI